MDIPQTGSICKLIVTPASYIAFNQDISNPGRRSGWRRPIVGDGSKNRDSVTDLLRICQTRLSHEFDNLPIEVVFQSMATVKQASDDPACIGRRASEIEKVKEASRFEYATDLSQCLLLHSRLEVVKHKRGEHSVKGGIGIWQFIRKPLIKSDTGRCRCGLPPCPGER